MVLWFYRQARAESDKERIGNASPPLTTAGSGRLSDRRLARPPGDLAEWAACRGVLINHRQ
ncbi:hypothetical protein DMH27_18800 [Raoultella planticola]|nr:hypothetical protein [Raoultella planticola]